MHDHDRLSRTREHSLAEALLVTLVSAVVPGLAHLRGGRLRAGRTLLVGSVLGFSALVLSVARQGEDLTALAVRPGWLIFMMVAAGCLAAGWALLIVRSYAAVRPVRLGTLAELTGGTVVAALCLLVVVPPLTLARYGYVQRDVVTSVFQAGGTRPLPTRPAVAVPSWQGMARLNILLIGGDADVDRPGIRTDSITVASINTATGATILLSLPRNLQHVPVWNGTRAVPFPRARLLNTVYQFGSAHPALVDRDVRAPGAELLKLTVGHILGLPVHFYAMVDMRSFRQIVDAIGGIRVCVDSPVAAPRQQVPAGVIRTGCRRLAGREALWYGRSRTHGSDYGRMSRQKCLLWAISRQATPLTVLRSFQRLAAVFKRSVHTDLPRDQLPRLITLSREVRGAQVSGLQFIPPLVAPGAPDLALIRRLTGQAVSGRHPGRELHDLRTSCT